PPPPELALAPGEKVLHEGTAAMIRGQGGGRWGPLILTNQRLLWYEVDPVIWPFKRHFRGIRFDEIARVDKGGLVDAIFGGRRLRIHLYDGRTVKLWEGGSELDWWVERLEDARRY